MSEPESAKPTTLRGLRICLDDVPQAGQARTEISRASRSAGAIMAELKPVLESYATAQASQWADAMGPLGDVQERMKALGAGFSAGSALGGLTEEIARQGRGLDALRSYASAMPRLEVPEPLRLPPIPPNPAHETNKRLARIEGQFGELQGLAVGYATVANRLQAAVAELVVKFDAAAADTTRSARIALGISVAATMLTLLGVVIPIAYSEYWQAPIDAAEADAFRLQVAAEIASVRGAQEVGTDRLVAAIRSLAEGNQEQAARLLEAIEAELTVGVAEEAPMPAAPQ